MAIQRGTAAVKAAKEEQDKRSGGNTYSLRLGAGESVTLRFYGDFEGDMDPIVGDNHYIKRLPAAKSYQMCAGNNPDGTHAGCVYCYAKKEGGDKGISLSKRAFFSVKDMRPIHKLEKEVKVLKPGIPRVVGKQYGSDDYITTKYPRCVGAKRGCVYCKAGSEPQLQGHRYWELALSYADALLAKQHEIRDFCTCGAKEEDGAGTITVSQYLCGNEACGLPVHFNIEQETVAHCKKCGHTKPPVEEIECSACSTPNRAVIQDFYWRVTRTGSDKSTSYQFEPIHPCQPPTAEELKEAEERKPNWDMILSAPPADVQAATLGIPNPFESMPGHGAKTYEQMESQEIDYGDGGDDVLENDTPAKPVKLLKKPEPSAQPVKKMLLLKKR